jgi:hypothetical protein
LFFFAMKRVRLILRNEPDNAGRLPRNCRKAAKELPEGCQGIAGRVARNRYPEGPNIRSETDVILSSFACHIGQD